MVMVAWAIAGAAVALALTECFAWMAVRRFRPRFQWLIRRKDVAPPIDASLVKKYVSGSFDPEIGWVPRPHSTGVDETSDLAKSYSIDECGRRSNPGFARHPTTVSVFGDSFAFCRMVNDDETWPHFLSMDLDTNVQNYGVGNYGIDQTYLRLRREIEKGSLLQSRIAIFVFTPETISRIHSYWRHYYEYGNILGFKPKFRIDGETISLCSQAATNEVELANYRERLATIQDLDPFFEQKFSKDLNRFPFSLQLITRWHRLPGILLHLTFGDLTGRRSVGWRRAMNIVLRENAREAFRLYGDPNATALLVRVVGRIAHACREVDVRPIMMAMPQPIDIENGLVVHPSYRQCIADMRCIVEVFDLSETLVSDPNWRDLFTDGLRGPHFHARGNRFVANVMRPVVLRHLRELNAKSTEKPESVRAT
jgi:hypothetical protein